MRVAKFIKTFAFAQVALVVMVAVTVTAMAGDYKYKTKKQKDIVDTAVAAGQFNTLAAALQAAGLVDTLKGDGPFTVFAPTDAAFAKLPEGTIDSLLLPENRDQLISILTYHVIAGKVSAAEVVKLDSARTINGASVAVRVADNGVKIGSANVVKTDIKTSNGIIHVIDSVILPN